MVCSGLLRVKKRQSQLKPLFYKNHAARLEKICYNSSDIGWGFSKEIAATYGEI